MISHEIQITWQTNIACVRNFLEIRQSSIEQGNDYKEKGKSCRIRDSILARLVHKHKNGELTDEQYFDEVVKCTADYDLPATYQVPDSE